MEIVKVGNTLTVHGGVDCNDTEWWIDLQWPLANKYLTPFICD